MDVSSGGKQEAWLFWIFTHDTVNVFFTKQAFNENIPTLPNHCNSLLNWLMLRGRDDLRNVKVWLQSISHKNGLKFS